MSANLRGSIQQNHEEEEEKYMDSVRPDEILGPKQLKRKQNY